MKIAVAASPEVAIPTLEYLLTSEHELALIISRPDSQVGRGRELAPTAVSNWAANHGIDLYCPNKVVDFDDFEDPDILRQGKLIHSIFSKLKYYYKRGIPVSIVTARSSSDIVRQFFLENGIDIHPDLVIAINDPESNLEGNIAERKQKAIKSLIDDGYINLIFFDDNEDNLRLAKNLEGYKNSRIKLIQVI